MDALTLDPLAGRYGRATYPLLPDDAPLAMPVQDLRTPPPLSAAPPRSPRLAVRRLLVVGGTAAATAIGTAVMARAFADDSSTVTDGLALAVFASLFAWVVFSFLTAAAGFVALLRGERDPLGIDAAAPVPQPVAPTALLMPICNESPVRVAAALQAMLEQVEAAGATASFHVFVLSDTSDATLAAEELVAIDALRGVADPAARIYYRRRDHNVERKAGNVADWVRRFGGSYSSFVLLDADSLMGADTLLRLADAMERHPRVALIQTLPRLVGGVTLFARMQQFAGRLYGPPIGHGMAWWHGPESNYWGHNAIIRTRAFAESAGLPNMRGPRPFGGHIMSHDFVEASLMRRRGWEIRIAPGLAGSYEGGPACLADSDARDRRWCQGNLQHAAVLPARGLHWVSRLHLLTGIGSYVTSPLWLLLLVAAFAPGSGDGSVSGAVASAPALMLFVITMALLLAPKLLGLAALAAEPGALRAAGGTGRVLGGIALESVLTSLLAPVVMVTRSIMVTSILVGRDSGWKPQRRDDGTVPFSELARRYVPHTLIGLALGGGAALVSVELALWMLPVVAGLVLAIPLAALTGDKALGRRVAAAGLLTTPDEREPGVLLRREAAIRRSFEPAGPAAPHEGGAAGTLFDDPEPILVGVAPGYESRGAA